MTRAAEALLMEKVRRGENVTPEDHLTTIDHPDELAAFMEALKANGRLTDDIRIAGLRRQKQIGASRGPASRP